MEATARSMASRRSMVYAQITTATVYSAIGASLWPPRTPLSERGLADRRVEPGEIFPHGAGGWNASAGKGRCEPRTGQPPDARQVGSGHQNNHGNHNDVAGRKPREGDIRSQQEHGRKPIAQYQALGTRRARPTGGWL